MNKDLDMCRVTNKDWEAECERLRAELCKLNEEHDYIRKLYDQSQRELAAANAKLEMVYLIFGERR